GDPRHGAPAPPRGPAERPLRRLDRLSGHAQPADARPDVRRLPRPRGLLLRTRRVHDGGPRHPELLGLRHGPLPSGVLQPGRAGGARGLRRRGAGRHDRGRARLRPERRHQGLQGDGHRPPDRQRGRPPHPLKLQLRPVRHLQGQEDRRRGQDGPQRRDQRRRHCRWLHPGLLLASDRAGGDRGL
ncbi:MAG: Flavodoxin reductases (ferredoxin-NADPH reductases) family 1, partial [uncultured Rubellimicrobium sp.]